MRFEISYPMNAPRERVFEILSDISRRPEWVGIASQRSQIGEVESGAGSTYRAVDKIPGRTLEYVQTIDRMDAPRLLEESWDGPMGGRSLIRLEGEGAQTTVVVEADVASPVPRQLGFLEPLFRAWARRTFRQDLDRLSGLVADTPT